jgi:Kdo2-lipid IVA lauroyltransferase/acyltransferase
MAAPLPKLVRRRLRSALLRLLIAALGLIPLGPALALGGGLGRLAWLAGWKTRRRSLEHLADAFPERSEEERRRIARDMFVHMGRSAMELAAIRWFDRRLDGYVELADPELLRQVMARGRGMVFVTGHLGNWELLARRIARAGVPNAVIAKASWDAKLDQRVARFRSEGGVTTLWREDPDTGRAIIRTLRSGKALGLLIDQDTRVQGVFVPFFGRLAFTPRAAADFAIRFRAPVVVGSIHRKGQGSRDGHRVELVEIPFSEDPPDREAEAVRLTAACTAALEAAIRLHPAEWVWMHERWHTRPPGEEGAGSQARPVPKTAELSGG